MLRRAVVLPLLLYCLSNAASALSADVSINVRTSDGDPVRNAVVFLIGGTAVQPGPTIKMVQKNQSFNPEVLAISAGTIVEFPNEDPVRHHVYSFSPAKRFELKLYGGDEIQQVTFDQSGVVAIGCNIHDDMLGYIYVVDSNLFGVTDQTGSLTLTGVEDGVTYEGQVWHPRLRGPARRTAQTISAGQSVTFEVRLKRDRREQSGSDFEEGVY